MATRSSNKWWLALLVSATVVGCTTLPCMEPLSVSVVSRERGEPIIVEQVFLVGDVSASMRSADKFPVEKSLVRSFAAAMPSGDYDAAIIDFGGKIDSKWYGHGSPQPPYSTCKCPWCSLPAKATATLSMELSPLLPFDRQAMANGAAMLDYRGGKTPLDQAFRRIQENLRDASGRTAIVLFSDGCASNEKAAVVQCRELVGRYEGEICIHTVHIGDDPAGAQFLRKLAAMSNSDCGSFRTAGGLSTGSQMEAFVREVMLGPPPPPKPAPPKPAPPKPAPPPVVDSDGDGVPDDKDHCPNSPRGVTVNERGCWIIPGLNFDTDKHDIKPQYHQQLDEVAEILEDNPQVRIRIDGHTDSSGTDEYNQQLSERRANAVMEYLAYRGVAGRRLRAKGWGESEPIRPNDTPDNMLMNRRVELTTHFEEDSAY